MPGFEFLRFAATGPRDARETAQKCNNMGEAAARAMAALAARVDVLEALMPQAQVSAQGAMTKTISSAPDPDIDGIFRPITFYDTINMAVRGCTLNTTNGRFTFEVEGKWLALFSFNTLVTGTGASRSTSLRVFNVTDLAAGPTNGIAVPGQSDAITATKFLPITVTAADVGPPAKEFVMEIGGGDTFTGVEWETLNLGLFYQDRFGSLVDPF